MPNKKTVVQTNSKPNSVKEVHLKVLTFKELWDNYVTGDPYDDPSGQFSNQCAIRMSATFHKVGIEMKSFSQKIVKPAPGHDKLGRILLDGKATAVRADELASWLQLGPIAGISKPENITGADWESKVKGRTGIIAFSGYWTRDGENAKDASGGHIDLWNGSRLTISGFWDGFATAGRYIGLHHAAVPFLGSYSDLRLSKTILFWPIK